MYTKFEYNALPLPQQNSTLDAQKMRSYQLIAYWVRKWRVSDECRGCDPALDVARLIRRQHAYAPAMKRLPLMSTP